MPAYDNYDGTEKFWRHYELSLLDVDKKLKLHELGKVQTVELDKSEWIFIWSVCIYYSVLVLGGNEMQPAQSSELLFVVFMNITGLIFMTWIAGEIAVLVAQVSIKSSAYQAEIDIINTAMKNAKLPTELQGEIRDHFLKVQGTFAMQEELTAFFSQISQPLRISVQRELFTKLLEQRNATIKETMREIASENNVSENMQRQKSMGHAISSSLSSDKKNLNNFVDERIRGFLPSIVQILETMLLPPHGIVIQQGDEGGEAASFFYVGKGDCKVNVKDERGKGIFIRRLLEGDHFGEVSIIYNCKRTATVISMNYNTFAFMRSLGYKRLVQDYPEYELCLRRYVTSRYKDHRIQFLKEIVKRIEYFDRVPSEIVYDLIFSLEIKHFDKDENVLQQNDVVDCIYFVEEGTLEVST